MAFKGMLRHPLSVSSEQLGRTCQEGWGALGPRPAGGVCAGLHSHFRPSVYLHYNLFLAKHQKLPSSLALLALCMCF